MRPSSLQVVTATFVVVLLVVLVTFVVLALRSDRQGDRAQKVADTPPPLVASPISGSANVRRVEIVGSRSFNLGSSRT